MTNISSYVVLGASGGIGNAVVRELVARGKRVRAVNRSGRAEVPSGVEIVRGDVTDPDIMRDVCRGAAAVFQCANVPYIEWEQKFPGVIDGAIEGAASANAKPIFTDLACSNRSWAKRYSARSLRARKQCGQGGLICRTL